MEIYQVSYQSPIGMMLIGATNEGIHRVNFIDDAISETQEGNHPHLVECIKQLDEYFNANRRSFSLALNPQGTPFQQKVWRALLKIPFGEIRTYGQIAAAIGNIKAARAVGMANNKNKIGIIIPCHRVIGANGQLTGYGGGLWRKEWLLKHEQESVDLA